MTRRYLIVLLLAAAQAQTLDEYLEARRKDWNVPGLAVAVVKDSRLYHLGVYGYRDVGGKKPVTRQTLFGIGSITKSLTVLALSSLVDEGKLDWDHPVREYAKDFALKDPVASEQATLRDLLSHRTGLARHDNEWDSSKLTRNEIFARFRLLEPDRAFRSRWEYNNLMYLAAGVVAERAAETSWEQLVSARIFTPLGWTRATTGTGKFSLDGDWSENYLERNGKPVRLGLPNIENIAPAGAINASIEEMARYLMVHLDSGWLDGKRVFPAAWFDHMRTPQMVKSAAQIPGEGKIDESYGLGLFVTTHRGQRLIWHTGTIGGYHGLLAYLPDQRIGVVILQNRAVRPLPQLIVRHVFDTLLGITPPDWNARYRPRTNRK